MKYKALIHFLHTLPCKKATRKTTGLCCLTVGATGLKLPGIPRDRSVPESANSLQQLWELLGMRICLSPAQHPNSLNTTTHFLITKKHLYVIKDFKYVDLHADMTLRETTKQWLEANNVSLIKWNLASSLVEIFCSKSDLPWFHCGSL